MNPPPSLTAQDRGTAWRVVLLGVAALGCAALVIGFHQKFFGRMPPLALSHVALLIMILEPSERFFGILGIWVFLITISLALLPLLLRDGLARALMLPCLLLLVLTSLIAWIQFWSDYQWYGTKRIVVYAAGNVLMTALCFFQYRAWRQDPEGPARRRLPLAMQLWLQTLWIPWPPFDD